MALVDPDSSREEGGTLDAIETWRSSAQDTELIDLGALRRATIPNLATGVREAPAEAYHQPRPSIPGNWSTRVLRTLLFADTVGFGSLS
ncbi:hypothetical protein ACFL0I_04180, partial [Gemmatimonadota bacterium]